MPDHIVSTITHADAAGLEAQIARVTARAFGCAGYDADVVQALQAQPDPVITVSTGPGGDVTGFCYGYAAAPDRLGESLDLTPQDLRPILDATGDAGLTGVLKTIVTDPSCQGQGVATKLVGAMEQGLAEKGAAHVVVPAWKAGERVNLAGTMAKTGYQETVTIGGFWRDACDAGGFACADRTHQCVCSAVFYTKRL